MRIRYLLACVFSCLPSVARHLSQLGSKSRIEVVGLPCFKGAWHGSAEIAAVVVCRQSSVMFALTTCHDCGCVWSGSPCFPSYAPNVDEGLCRLGVGVFGRGPVAHGLRKPWQRDGLQKHHVCIANPNKAQFWIKLSPGQVMGP